MQNPLEAIRRLASQAPAPQISRWLSTVALLAVAAAVGLSIPRQAAPARIRRDQAQTPVDKAPQRKARQERRLSRRVARGRVIRTDYSDEGRPNSILLCQAPGDLPAPKRARNASRPTPFVLPAASPAAPYPLQGIDCAGNCNCGVLDWSAFGPIDWPSYAQGEYAGHARLPHVPEYRLRVDDQIELIFRITRDETSQPYQLNVGDEIEVEYREEEGANVNRKLVIQPDGTITIRLLGQVRATRKTVDQLRLDLEEKLKPYIREPSVTVTPVKVNTKLEDLRATADSRMGFGGTARTVTVTPEGTIGLAALGSVPAQGLTLEELKLEIDERYARIVEGIEVTPVLLKRAPRYVYVLGEVKTPGRFTLEGPTTAMQALSLAGGWNVGANVRQIVVFRRADDWRLVATMLDLRGALYGKQPCPADEIWLNDSDIVVVPKSPILVADDLINLVFTRGIYGVFPFNTSVNFTNLTSLGR